MLGNAVLSYLFPLLLGVVGIVILVRLAATYDSAPDKFWPQATLLVASVSVIIAAISLWLARRSLEKTEEALELTRYTTRPFLTFGGTIRILGPLKDTNLAFPLTNTGSLPANNVRVRIDSFGKDEEIELYNISGKYREFLDTESDDNDEALTLFPDQTWQYVLRVDLTRERNEQLWQELLGGQIALRITISYRCLERKLETIQTLGFDELSLTKDDKHSYLHGLSINPQSWV